jgi:hypothetical protein
MYRSSSNIILSATNLSGFSECEHKTVLDLAVTAGALARPGQNDLERKMLELRGREHEARVLAHYRAEHRNVVTIATKPAPSERSFVEAADETEVAMRDGADPGVLFDCAWLGGPDFSVRAPGREPSSGPLLRGCRREASSPGESPRRTTALRVHRPLGAPERLQGRTPEHFWSASGGDDVAPAPHRTADYTAYYPQMRARLQAFTADEARAEPRRLWRRGAMSNRS